MKRSIIITGGAGFIGSHVVRLFVNKYPDYRIINVDKLTYAGNLANLKDIEEKANYRFVKADICDFDAMLALMQEENVDGIIHLAAESHVDRSIKDPFTFARTNVMGTLSLLQAAKLYWESLPDKYDGKRFYHISTDEVYGALELSRPEGIEPPFTTTASSGDHHLAYGTDFFYETTKYNPHSPYSASKASSDHFVRAYHDTYGMPTIVTNCSNNYGPYQFPEKLIPLFINNIRRRKPLPVYGKGAKIRPVITWINTNRKRYDFDKFLIFAKCYVGEEYINNCWHILNGDYHCLGNMFICKKELIDEYCSFIFDLLDKYHKAELIYNRIPPNRIFGYFAEFLFAAWLKMKNKKIKWIRWKITR